MYMILFNDDIIVLLLLLWGIGVIYCTLSNSLRVLIVKFKFYVYCSFKLLINIL